MDIVKETANQLSYMSRYEVNEAKAEKKKVAWMKDFESFVKKNHPSYRGNICWDTATYMFNKGMSAKDAAASKHVLKNQ